MEKEASDSRTRLIEDTVYLIVAFLSNNNIASSELPPLISAVHSVLSAAAEPRVAQDAFEKPTQAEIRRSVKPDGLMSFIDGRTYKTLKRHLRAHGLDSGSYRERYGLPQDYPMVAPRYSETRSTLAHSLGLGKLRRRYTETPSG